jgi:ABC-2 type transport system ATP-binding protein
VTADPDGAGREVSLELIGLSRRFGSVVALDGLTFSVPPGEVFGFLGPNGAGKTTTMRAIFGVVALEAGQVRWQGQPVTEDARHRFGYMPEERGLYPSMQILEQLEYLGRLHEMTAASAREAARHWIGRLGLAGRESAKLEALSHGNQQRVQLAAALMHDPELLVLDEPFAGLDPGGVDDMTEILAERARAGVTVVFSSHQLDLVEHICESVAIIHRGRVVAQGAVSALERGDRLRLAVRVATDPGGDWARQLDPGIASVERVDAGMVLLVLAPDADAQKVLDTARAAGPVDHFSFATRRLSEVFRRHRRGRMSSRWIRLTAIVAEREIRQRGRSRAFLISTIVLLLVVVAGVAIPAILAHNAKPQRVGVVGGQLAAMTEIVPEAGRLTGTGVTVVPQPSLAAAEAALRSGQLDVVLANDSEVVVKQVSVADSSGSGGGLASAIADVAGLSKLVGQLPPGAADRGVTLPVRGLTPPSASLSRRLTGLFTVVLVWVLISAYGSQIAMGVGEEKQNRIVEVILASVRPLQLLVGKVTGIGTLALAQAALMVAAFLGIGAAVGSSLVHGAAPGIVITGAVFLILGYAFYCTAYAAAGSLVSRQSDVGAVILPVQVPLIIAYALSYTVIYADGANVFYRVLGFLPPTAPIAMPVLYAAGDVPAWQAAVSAVLVAAGTVWMARTAATIYGRSILRTGSRVRLRQVLTRRGEAA